MVNLFLKNCLKQKKAADSNMFWIIIGIVLALIVLGALIFFFFSGWNPLADFIKSFTQTSTSGIEQI